VSNIPLAKAIIDKLLESADMTLFVRHGLVSARELLDREKPDFIHEPFIPPLTKEQVRVARALRDDGWALQKIADELGSQIGRVSEAVNGHRDGI
jgi:DNA-binding NarL/FixJ family response regulator